MNADLQLALNQVDVDNQIASEAAEFGAIAPVGQVLEARWEAGQIGWAVIVPSRALTNSERRKLHAAGWKHLRDAKYGENVVGCIHYDYETTRAWVKE